MKRKQIKQRYLHKSLEGCATLGAALKIQLKKESFYHKVRRFIDDTRK